MCMKGLPGAPKLDCLEALDFKLTLSLPIANSPVRRALHACVDLYRARPETWSEVLQNPTNLSKNDSGAPAE